ncbi:MAG: ABC transporter permease [Acetatifactor sp.]|nr:ABC transporter permease [Acetatifactor sp.]
MHLNPIVKKDVKVQSRSMKICWGIFAYELILALVFFLAMLVIQQNSIYSGGQNIYNAMVWLYPILAVTQLVILGIVVPVRTAASISGEKERQTFDIMMTTSMTPFSVILGKVMTAIVQSMFYVVAGMPIMALPFIIGGMSWSSLFWFLGVALLVSVFSASIGILCSSICRKSISAVIMSYGIYLIFFLGTGLPYLIYQLVIAANNSYGYVQSGSGDNLLLLLLLNPAVYLLEFFAEVMIGESVAASMLGTMSSTQPGGLVRLAASEGRWLIISTVVFLAVIFLFLWLAARRIDPVRQHRRRQSMKSKA